MSKKNENMFAIGAVLFFVMMIALAVPQLMNKRSSERKCGHK